MYLHRLLGLRLTNEEPYTRIAKRLGVSDDEPMLLAVEQCKADIAVYDIERPVAVIENKILSDGKRSLAAFAWDLRKGDAINLSKRVPVYAIALICETETGNLESQKQWIEQRLGRSLNYSKEEKTRAPDEYWQWCFGCVCEWWAAEQD